jgi:predicted Zn-dependent protease with MMP-like domain
MAQTQSAQKFEDVVEWAYSTLPQKIRELPDFPGIQVINEPPKELFERISKRRDWLPGGELLGCFSGISRSGRRFNLIQTAPDLIFVFQGPILRCSRGNLLSEVKQVVWHEVAHWLGHAEEEIKELGLAFPPSDEANDAVERDAAVTISQRQCFETPPEEGETNEQPRCPKCYSAKVACRELEKPLTYSLMSDPVSLHAKICSCQSCGYEWDDEDNR